MSDPVTVLDYWLEEIGEAGWYSGTEEVDADVRERFAETWEAAQRDGLSHWISGPAGALAFILLTDQFSRNMWRGTGDAFATDQLALDAARKAIAEGWDLAAPEPERQFFYLPFMHSEDLSVQKEGYDYLSTRMPETGASNVLHSQAHIWVIEKFGRFPYRNAALSRETTPDEAEFLEKGGYAHAVEQVKAAIGA